MWCFTVFKAFFITINAGTLYGMRPTYKVCTLSSRKGPMPCVHSLLPPTGLCSWLPGRVAPD